MQQRHPTRKEVDDSIRISENVIEIIVASKMGLYKELGNDELFFAVMSEVNKRFSENIANSSIVSSIFITGEQLGKTKTLSCEQ